MLSISPVTSIAMKSYCYLDGTILPSDQARISIHDLGLQRGYGVFDFMRTYNGHLFQPRKHLERFRHSAAALHLEISQTDEELLNIGQDLLRRSELDHPALKFILTGGDATPAMPYDAPRLLILAENHPVYPEAAYEDGVSLMSVEYQRELPEVKSLNYMNTLRLEQWKRSFQAFDLLYHHPEYGVTESPRANVFGVCDQTILTPSAHVLNGITRGVILELAAQRYQVEERPISLTELRDCQELFLTSTSKRIMPVTELDQKPVGSGRPGPITRKLMALFDDFTHQTADSE
jgi:branched-chain amino acid aminotransferase